MLKLKLNSEMKETVILLVFTALMVEVLTFPTIIMSVISSILLWLKIRPNKVIRNILTLAVFVAYWFTYGKVIDPEIGLNFLTTIILFKLLEKESSRDQYMIFFGLILLISAGSLFQKNLMYVFFFACSFFILIQDFYSVLRLPQKVTDVAQSLLWVLPFTAFLFIFVPRMMNPFQLESGQPGKGELGYTPDVNLTSVESLTGNGQVVFHALVSEPLPNHQLYWRGNTLSFTDGWNWPLMPNEKPQAEYSPLVLPNTGIRQKFRVYAQHDFFFGLDSPEYISTTKGTVETGPYRSLGMSRWQGMSRYEVISKTSHFPASDIKRYENMRSSLEPEGKAWVMEHFQEKNVLRLREKIERYFTEQQFSYSLEPGKVDGFMDFMLNKKVGFCSHYASAVAQIFRANRIPVRLVSGFMGGAYNRYGKYYLVTQNDAHVWVEAIHKGKWLRMDPTEWIAPDRVNLGGEAFVNQVAGDNLLSPMRFLGGRFTWFKDFQQWFSQWDFRFYQWLEEMDYYSQNAFLDKLNFKREWIYSLLPTLLALFMGLYAWHLSRRKKSFSELETLWFRLQSKLREQGLELPLRSISEEEGLIRQQSLPDKENILRIWQELVTASFRDEGQDLRQLKKKIDRL